MRSLRDYHAKRRFSETPEPEGREGASGDRLRFVVQKHDATRLHYDFRLEWGGVLLSWAVTRGPSSDPAQKRLAVRTEDHPLDYAGFEGTIPKGNYGAGTVLLWDDGWWEPLHDPDTGLAEGKLHFILHGARMRGGWALVRIKNRKGSDTSRENWLLIKERDAEATETADALTATHLTSVTTGRRLDEIAKGPKQRHRRRANPAFVTPQLATLQTDVPQGAGWWHEVKMDGYRGQISIGRDGIRIYSRSGGDWTDRFAPLVQAATDLPCDSALIDGEVMAESGDFTALQMALKGGGPLLFYAFDLLHLDGQDLTTRPLKDRRRALDGLFEPLPERGPLRLSPVVLEQGQAVLRDICAAGGEGIVSKRTDAPYRSGRWTNWIKVKCARRAEFVILGYQPSDKPGRPFASLHLGSFEKTGLVYRGKVGAGFDTDDFDLLLPLFSSRSPAPAPLPIAPERRVVWITPDLVAEIRFAEYTGEGRIRHGVYLGLREDKPAMHVSAEGAPDDPAPVFAGIKITNPQRAVFPDDGVTKAMLARYLADVGDAMLVDLADRPLAFVRHPDGIAGKGFFQKHKGEGWPDAIRTFTEPDGDERMVLRDTKGIVAAAQMGVVEYHIQGVRRDRMDRPDRMVFDLDPDPAVGFADLVSAAADIRDLLGAAGLPSFAMVTGGKGIHVIVPLRRTATQEAVTDFARSFATLLADQDPVRFIATMSKAKRAGRVFVDWLRNQREATAICPWSVRARPGARVAVPVDWDELPRLPDARSFTLDAARERAKSPPQRPSAVALSAPVIAALDTLLGQIRR